MCRREMLKYAMQIDSASDGPAAELELNCSGNVREADLTELEKLGELLELEGLGGNL